jgi:YHS domain-containing protein
MKKLKLFAIPALVVVIGALAAMLAFAKEQPKSRGTDEVSSASAYPLDYCLVSGEKLGSMGDAVVKTYDGREVKFCCGMCPPKFEKDKAAYMKKLDDAIVQTQKANYPLETCVVSGEPLVHSEMGDPVDYVYQNRLVRFCCNGCVKTFNKNPGRFLSKLDAAAAEKAAPAPAPDQQ